MKKQVKILKSGFLMVLGALLLIQGASIALAAGGGNGGSVGVGNKVPEVLSFSLYENDHVTGTSSFTPMTSYWIDIVAKDKNKEIDLDQVKITLFHDSNNLSAGTVAVAGDEKTAVIITWDKGASWGALTPSVDDGTGSWAVVGQSYTADSGVQATWKINFTVGKVSSETTGTEDWDLEIIATDVAGAPSVPFTGFGNTMNWYGEITSEVTTEFDFGTLVVGDVDKPITLVNGGAKAFFDTYPVTNGAYKFEVKTSAMWGTLNFGTDITALKVDDDAVLDGDTLLVSTTYQVLPGHTADAATSESGATVSLYAWISLASEGLETGNHAGTLFVSILAD